MTFIGAGKNKGRCVASSLYGKSQALSPSGDQACLMKLGLFLALILPLGNRVGLSNQFTCSSRTEQWVFFTLLLTWQFLVVVSDLIASVTGPFTAIYSVITIPTPTGSLLKKKPLGRKFFEFQINNHLKLPS